MKTNERRGEKQDATAERRGRIARTELQGRSRSMSTLRRLIAGVADAALGETEEEAVGSEPDQQEEGLEEEAGTEQQLGQHAVLSEDDEPQPGNEPDGLGEDAEDASRDDHVLRFCRECSKGAQKRDA